MSASALNISTWRIGPFSELLPGPLALKLDLDGELIAGAQVERGFLHRGVEKSFEVRRWGAVSVSADRVDPECAPSYELAVVSAVEEIAGVTPAPRIEAIRRVVCELSRIASHLLATVRMAQAVGSETIPHYLLRDRERVLELFELLVGSRFAFNFLRVGGVAAEVSDGFCERALQVCDLLRERLREYNDILSFNEIFSSRTRDLGVLSAADVSLLGITGPNARAAGVAVDARRQAPYCGYALVDSDMAAEPSGEALRGSAHDRFLQRLREIHESISIVRESLGLAAEAGGATLPPVPEIPAGECYVRVEGPRGAIGCYVVSDGGEFPARVQFVTPSLRALAAVPRLLRGTRLEDLRLLLASLDISVSEADR